MYSVVVSGCSSVIWNCIGAVWNCIGAVSNCINAIWNCSSDGIVASWAEFSYKWCVGTIIVVIICLPLLFLLILFSSFYFLSLYNLWYRQEDFEDEVVWRHVAKIISSLWLFIGRIWHGVEFLGFENIETEKKRGALLVFYHSSMFPVESCYLSSEFVKRTQRRPRILTHRGMFKFPGASTGMKMLGIFPGPYTKFVEYLKNDELVLVAPGGAFEAVFSNGNYKLSWNNKVGFARAAIEAKVPIIPTFTENGSDAFKCAFLPFGLSHYIYEKTGIILTFPYGGWPTKLRIHIGEPIPYDEQISPGDLANKVANQIQDLIFKNQRVPGSMFQSVRDRFRKCKMK